MKSKQFVSKEGKGMAKGGLRTEKVLFCATIDEHFRDFHLPYMKWFQEQGWQVHVIANGSLKLPYAEKKFNIPIERSPFHFNNIKAYRELKAIIDTYDYQIIHCHTPMGGMLTRLASRKAREKGSKVIYTAHGFHFYKGSPLLSWIVYYPIERYLACFTDCLITINQEDYYLAQKRRFNAGRIEHVHGVGIDINRFGPSSEDNKQRLRQRYGYKPDDFLMFYAAEFNKNKNQQLLIRTVAKIKRSLPNVRLLLAGNGLMIESCRELSRELDVYEVVDFLGYRNDINKIMAMCDIVVASSYREGLPVNIMEAMACGLPVIASDNRGHRELICDDKNGWLVRTGDIDEMSEKIKMIAKTEGLRNRLGCCGREFVEKYTIDQVLAEMSAIYSNFMG